MKECSTVITKRERLEEMSNDKEMTNNCEALTMLITRIAESLEAIAQSNTSVQFTMKWTRPNPSRRGRAIVKSGQYQIKQTAQNARAAEQKVDDLLAAYITEHQRLFTTYITKQALWTENVPSDCAGRFTQAGDGSWTLSVPAARFGTYMRERGIARQHLRRWVGERKARVMTGLLVSLGSPMRVYVIPIKGVSSMSQHGGDDLHSGTW